eukprot:1140612-Pelagomonas_calceolata.AAC.2
MKSWKDSFSRGTPDGAAASPTAALSHPTTAPSLSIKPSLKTHLLQKLPLQQLVPVQTVCLCHRPQLPAVSTECDAASNGSMASIENLCRKIYQSSFTKDLSCSVSTACDAPRSENMAGY